MRVLHIIHALDPGLGGPPVVAVRLAAAQASVGVEAAVLSYADPGRASEVAASTAHVPHWAAVDVLTCPPQSTIRRWFESALASRLEDWLDEAGGASMSTVVFHGMWDAHMPACARLLRRRRTPYMVVPHGMLHEWSLSQRRWKKRLALAVAFRRVLEHAAFIHCLNHEEVRQVERLGLPTPLEVIPNGIFEQEVTPIPEPGDFRQRHPEVGQHPYVLFLSRLHYKKGLDYLVEAFSQVVAEGWSGHLVVAGPDGGSKADLLERVRSHGVEDRVHVLDPIYGQEKLGAFREATCFCLPSRQEGFSMAIIEAMACRCPVVISESCYFPEVAEAGAGVVVTLERGEVARALRRVIEDPDGATEMGKAGRELALSTYTWPRIAERSIELYRRHASGG